MCSVCTHRCLSPPMFETETGGDAEMQDLLKGTDGLGKPPHVVKAAVPKGSLLVDVRGAPPDFLQVFQGFCISYESVLVGPCGHLQVSCLATLCHRPIMTRDSQLASTYETLTSLPSLSGKPMMNTQKCLGT